MVLKNTRNHLFLVPWKKYLGVVRIGSAGLAHCAREIYMHGPWLGCWLGSVERPASTRGWGTACCILGYWFNVGGWAVQNEKLTSSLLTILAQVLACGLSMCNKVCVWNWIVGGMLSYWAPIVDITTTVGTVEKHAEAAAKGWFGLHFSVSSRVLHTPTELGGCGLVWLDGLASACQASHLVKCHHLHLGNTDWHFNPLLQACRASLDILAACGQAGWTTQPSTLPLHIDKDSHGTSWP